MRFVLAVLSFCLTSPSFLRADSLEGAAHALARKVLAVMQPSRAGCVTWQNRAGLPEARSLQLRTAFLSDLRELQPATAPDQACGLRVLIERTPTSLVLSAKVPVADGFRVLVAQVPRTEMTKSVSLSSTFRLQKDLVWRQTEPVLDALFVSDLQNQQSMLVVLSRDAVSLIRKQDSEWKLSKTWPLAVTVTDRRAPRGELQLSADTPRLLKIVLPGKVCEMNLDSDSLPSCKSTAEAWRVGVELASPCSSISWRLRTGSTDWSSPDRLGLMDSSLPRSQEPAAEVTLPGPVLSISDSSPPSAGAAAVVFNLASGNYEVYAITLDCSD